MKQFKIRASSAGTMLTNPRSKTETIAVTVKTFLQDWLKEQIYGFRKEIKSKYLTKGLKLEDTAIDKTIEWLDIPFTIKNETHFEDEYFTGTPDLIVDGIVYDTKCSWDAFTFPLFDETIPTMDYFYQLQVYMHLTGNRSAKLVYVLLNTPDELTYEQKHNYDELDKKYRIKTYDVEYDEKIITELQSRCVAAREYISTFKY